MTTTTYETPSRYIPAGATFDGPGPSGIVALVEAADADNAAWGNVEDWSWADFEAAVHSRTVDGVTVWGLYLARD